MSWPVPWATLNSPAIFLFAHRVLCGDRIILTRSLEPAPPTGPGVDHYIGCTLGAAFEHARPGERVWLDDGKIGGIIESVSGAEIAVTVTDIRPRGGPARRHTSR
jgi:pyruvate kinase